MRKFDSEGQDLGLFVTTDLLGPTNIWFDDNGDLLVVDYNGTAVKRFDSEGNYLSDFMTGLLYAEGVQYLPNGDILIGNGNTSSVKRYSGEGVYLSEFVESGAEDLLTPNAVVLRYNATVGIDELVKTKAKIVYPSIGTHFTFYDYNRMNVAEIIISSINGERVKGIDLTNDPHWDASSFSEGVYIITAYFNDSSILRQKVIVRRNK